MDWVVFLKLDSKAVLNEKKLIDLLMYKGQIRAFLFLDIEHNVLCKLFLYHSHSALYASKTILKTHCLFF